MCGICGMAGAIDEVLLVKMTSIIHHRGPDDSGIYLSPDGQAALGNRRLAIIDLSSAGHMPMQTEDGELWITYNGEVYNFPELRAHLRERGHLFKSGTDTEVILHMYQEYGAEAFKRLNGIFGLAIWDARHRELVLARDRFGVKPLYYTTLGRQLLFSSEIKSLLLDPRVSREPDPEAIHYFLGHLWVPGPGTMFKNILKLQPGHYLKWNAGKVDIRPYWKMEWPEDNHAPVKELARELRAVLYRAVKRNLIADVPLGVFLSGGLDSSILLGMTSKITRAPVDAYTIAFRSEDARLEQAGGDDERYAELVAKHFGANFHRIQVDPDIVSLLPKVLWHLDEPVADPAAIATLLIAEAARSRSTVLLSGQGADEVFGGYRVQMADRFSRPLAALPSPVRKHALRPMLDALPGLADRIPGASPGLVLAYHRYFSKVLAGSDLPREERYIFNRSYYTQADQLELYRPELREQFARFNSGDRHREYFEEVADASFVNRMLHVDLKTFLPELNLTYGDKLSMAASIETRVPFLDNEVVDFMSRVPAGLKIRGVTGKYLLRRAVAGLVPEAVIKRRKAGFGAPIRKWLDHDLAGMVDELLSPTSVRNRGYFDPAAVSGLVARDRRGEQDNTYRIWALLTLELWHQIFVDGVRAPASAPELTLSLDRV